MKCCMDADEKSRLFDTENWRDIVITEDEHIEQLLNAYDILL